MIEYGTWRLGLTRPLWSKLYQIPINIYMYDNIIIIKGNIELDLVNKPLPRQFSHLIYICDYFVEIS